MKARYIACSTIAAISLIAALVLEAAAQVTAQEVIDLEEQRIQEIEEQEAAECHLQTLVGSFEAPELAGQNFLAYWGGRPVAELMEMVISMPPGEEGSLDQAVYANIVAYLLERNGFPSGPAELLADATGTLAGSTGPQETPTTTPSRSTGPATPTRTAFGGRGSSDGTSTFHEVTDFRPVTGESCISHTP